MNNLKRIFFQLFEQQPHIFQVPGWSRMSPEGLVQVLGTDPEEKMYLAIAARDDSQFQFYNDSYQSHYSAMVSEKTERGRWYTAMEDMAHHLMKKGYPIRGFNLYLIAAGHRKHGKTYELLMKTAIAKALSEIYHLKINKQTLTTLICETNNDSVLDSLFLGQIYRHSTLLEKPEAVTAL